jgi:hypothetical protein
VGGKEQQMGTSQRRTQLGMERYKVKNNMEAFISIKKEYSLFKLPTPINAQT